MGAVIRKAVIRAVVATALVAAGLMFLSIEANNSKESVSRPNAVGSAIYYMDKHDCWTGTAPEGATARHAVITEAGVTRYVRGAKFEQALAHVFGEPTEIETVHGFCR